jgi:hypothetical protein
MIRSLRSFMAVIQSSIGVPVDRQYARGGAGSGRDCEQSPAPP